MKGRVIYSRVKDVFSHMVMWIDWGQMVEAPAQQGYYIQAFASADALIDWSIRKTLQGIYNTPEARHLIDQLESSKAETKFFGTGHSTVLKKIGAIEKRLCDKIIDFKGARNLVSHTTHGEYALLDIDIEKIKSQEELDQKVKQIADKKLVKGKEIFDELNEIRMGLTKKFQTMTPEEKLNWISRPETR